MAGTAEGALQRRPGYHNAVNAVILNGLRIAPNCAPPASFLIVPPALAACFVFPDSTNSRWHVVPHPPRCARKRHEDRREPAVASHSSPPEATPVSPRTSAKLAPAPDPWEPTRPPIPLRAPLPG